MVHFKHHYYITSSYDVIRMPDVIGDHSKQDMWLPVGHQ